LEADERDQRLIRFVQRLTGLRHRFPTLRQKRFLSGVHNEEARRQGRDLDRHLGKEMTEAEWKDANTRCFGMLLDGRAQQTGIKQPRPRGDPADHLQQLQDTRWKFSLPGTNGGGRMEPARRHQHARPAGSSVSPSAHP